MTGSVAQLWRFPVKSMGGAPGRRGAHRPARRARRPAVGGPRRREATSPRRPAGCPSCSAARRATLTEPGPDAGPGNVPGGRDHDARRHANCPAPTRDSTPRSRSCVGREVRLTALPPRDDTSQHRMSVRQTRWRTSRPTEVRKDFGLSDTEALPDTSVFTTKQIITLARFSTPPGTFVDLSPVHLLSTASLASLAADGDPYDVRRFRPNVLVDVDEPDSGVSRRPAWVGGDVDIGDGGAATSRTRPSDAWCPRVRSRASNSTAVSPGSSPSAPTASSASTPT